MARFIIQGPSRVEGVYEPTGNKNAALPMLAACLLTDEPVVLHNVPQIDDVEVMLQLLGGMGVGIEREGRTVRLCAAALSSLQPDPVLCRRIRGSLILSGPLAARHGRATIHAPGGDVIGRRRVDTHLEGLEALGIEGSFHEGAYHFRRHTLHGCHHILDEASVTATENILMAATLAPGTTILYNAACEPHVQDLCRLLARMGAFIDGIGTNRLVIEGVPALHGAEHQVSMDHIEAGSFIVAAAATGGSLTLPLPADPDELIPFRVMARVFAKLGVAWETTGDTLHLKAGQPLVIANDMGGAVAKIEDGIWPAFPSDLMSVMLVLATQARGSVLFFEKLFESRMYFVDRLIEMGARIVPCDPHRVVVEGPAHLRAAHQTSPDIRAGMALLIAALCAEGESVIENAQMIDRGYEAIDVRLRALGASIQRA